MDFSTCTASSFLPQFARNLGDSFKKHMATPPNPAGIARTMFKNRQGVNEIPKNGISNLNDSISVGYVSTEKKSLNA